MKSDNQSFFVTVPHIYSLSNNKIYFKFWLRFCEDFCIGFDLCFVMQNTLAKSTCSTVFHSYSDEEITFSLSASQWLIGGLGKSLQILHGTKLKFD